MKKTLRFRPFPWLCCAGLALVAYACRFVYWGYSFSALVACVLIGIIAFYEITWMLRGKYPKATRLLRRIFTVCLCIGLLIFGITEGFIIHASFGSPEEQTDYLLVLGAKVRVTGPSTALWERIRGAYNYLEAHPDTIALVSGGQGPDEPMTEAQSMYDELVAMGIDPERIWVEDKATSTWENLNFSLDLIQEKTGSRPTRLAVVSNEYHLFRTSLFAKKCGVDFVGIPAHSNRITQRINHFMREVAGVWHYLLLGGQYD